VSQVKRVKQNAKRVSQNKMWTAARFYCAEAKKCLKAKAYFSAVVARGSELEALLRIFDFVEARKPKDRCRDFYGLINRAFKKHWIPHDALRAWKKAEHTPLKVCLHEIRKARNGVHAHLFNKDLAKRHLAANITYVVHAMYSFLEIKNARIFMQNLHDSGHVSDAEYRAWKKKQSKID
jgi:hypothetical protein